MQHFNILFLKIIALALLVVKAFNVYAEQSSHSVLMVVSSYGQPADENQRGERPGYEFEEFAKAYLVFKNNGIEIDIASPKGGSVHADKYDPTKVYNAAVLSDEYAMEKINNTLKTSDVNASDYDAVFVVGGKGAMFDLVSDTSLQQVIADVYQGEGTVAAVCHGPAALVDVKMEDGNYLVAGKVVNGFTNHEEKLFGKKWIDKFGFLLEDKLVERGGKFQSSPIMLNHVAIDERLITGQNPTSTVAVAQALVSAMGLKVVIQDTYPDDKTLAVVAKILNGDGDALSTVKTQQDNYNVALIGMYGYYYLKTASQDKDFNDALTLMLLAKDKLKNPRLDMEIAKVQHRLGNSQSAAQTLKELLARSPDFKPAKAMLDSLLTE